MNDHIDRKAVACLAALAFLLIAGMVGTAAGAEIRPETETTNSSEVSDYNNSSTLEGYEPTGNDSWTLAVNQTVDNSSNLKAHFEKGDWSKNFTSGWTFNASGTSSHGGTTTNVYYWNLTISENDTRYMPVSAGENETVTITVYNNTSISNESDMASTTINQSVNVTDNRTVLYVGTDSESLTLDTESVFLRSDNKRAEVSSDGVDVEGDNTTIDVKVANTTAQDRASNNAVTGSPIPTSSGADLDNQDGIDQMSYTIDGSHRLAFYDEANTDIVDTDSDTYAVYDSTNDVMEYHLGSSGFSDASSVDVLWSTDELDFMTRRSVASNYDGVSTMDWIRGFENLGG